MIQPAASYSEGDLQRVIERDYPAESRQPALVILGEYGTQPWHGEVLRVQMACLKCAGGSLEQLAYWVGIATRDYRDVLASAEYPSYGRAKSADAKSAAIQADWAQLQAWLRRS